MDRSSTNTDEVTIDIENTMSDKEDVGVSDVESVVIDMPKMEQNMDSAERKLVKEKRKKMSNKKGSRPPRPPRGPSLDAADLKLIREITELAMLKRMRTERVKMLKKMKAAKPSSSLSNTLFAMIFTVIFCLLILLQGISTRSSSRSSLDGSLSSSAPEPDFISAQVVRQAAAADYRIPASRLPSLVELVSGQDPRDRAKSVPI